MSIVKVINNVKTVNADFKLAIEYDIPHGSSTDELKKAMKNELKSASMRILNLRIDPHYFLNF